MNIDIFLEKVKGLSKSTQSTTWVELFECSLNSEDDYHQVPYFDVLIRKVKELVEKGEASEVINAIKSLWEMPKSTIDSNEYILSLDQVISCYGDSELKKYRSTFSVEFIEGIIKHKYYQLEDKIYLILRLASMGVLKTQDKNYFENGFYSEVKRKYPIAWVDILVYSDKYNQFNMKIIGLLNTFKIDFTDDYYQKRIELWGEYLLSSELIELRTKLLDKIQNIKRNSDKDLQRNILSFINSPKTYKQPEIEESVCEYA